jgi:hypothetical protein
LWHEKVLERWYIEVVVWGKRLSWSGKALEGRWCDTKLDGRDNK